MRIALTHPSCWPYVRRGSERFLHELGHWLTGRGHDVVTVSSRPGTGADEDGYAGRRILHAEIASPALAKLRVQPAHAFALPCWRTLRALDPDAVHALFYTDWVAATRLPQRARRRVVLQINGIPVPAALHRRWPPEHWMVRSSLARADRVVVPSRFVADGFRTHWGALAEPMICPLNADEFAFGEGPPDGVPTVLAAADFDVPRKGVRVLVQAFAALKRELPALRLRLSGRCSEATQHAVLGPLPDAVRRDVELLGLGDPAGVPRQYREATLFVVPALWEPSGGAMLEAWAAGTPVVASDHGGLPEFLAPEVGALFAPGGDGEQATDAAALAAAIRRGLELASDPATRKRCRVHAERFSWQALGPEWEALYRA